MVLINTTETCVHHLVHAVEHVPRHDARRLILRLTDRHPDGVERFEAVIEIPQVVFVKRRRDDTVLLSRKIF